MGKSKKRKQSIQKLDFLNFFFCQIMLSRFSYSYLFSSLTLKLFMSITYYYVTNLQKVQDNDLLAAFQINKNKWGISTVIFPLK